MRVQFRLNLRRLVLALIALLSFGAILLKQSDQYLRASAAVQTVASVNAANYEAGSLARGSLASVFGNNLAAKPEKSSTNPGPTSLGGVSVQVVDSAKVTHDAQLVYVSAGQINYVVPEGAAPGDAEIIIKNGEKAVASGKLKIVDTAPALFNSVSGERKLAVGMTSTDGVAGAQSIVDTNGSPRMISSGAAWAPNTLTLLATGLRFASNVQVKMGDRVIESVSVSQSETPGVDAVTLRIPMTLRGGMNTISLVASGPSSATTQSSATTLAAGEAQSSSTTQSSNAVQALIQGDAMGPNVLSADDVRLIIGQGVAKAQQMGVLATFAITDQEGNVLVVFKMTGAPSTVLIGATDLKSGQPTVLRSNPIDGDSLDGVTLPLAQGLGLFSDGAALAAISKAGTAAFFCTQGSAISTRTASFIVQANIPPRVNSQPGGDLFGVQFSSLPCSDVRNPRDRNLQNLPLGLSGDPGGVGIYKNGFAVGGIGVEFNGFYSVDVNVFDDNNDIDPEEVIANAAIRGFRVPPVLAIDKIRLNGMGVPYITVPPSLADGPPAPPFASLPGSVIAPLDPVTNTPVVRGQQVSAFTPLTLGGIPGRVAQGFFPFQSSQVSNLTAGDVTQIIIQAAQGAYRGNAAIRAPAGSPIEVNICVVDTSGKVLGAFSTQDAPNFGFDVSCQKARNSLFFSRPDAAAQLQAAEANVTSIVPGSSVAKYVGLTTQFGFPLNGSIAVTSRAVGFLARPTFPDGIPNTPNAPLSKPIANFSPFNTGLQLALVKPALVRLLTGGMPPSGDRFNCSPIPNDITVGAGLMIFAGGVPLFKNGALSGAIGISGDGIEEDEFVASNGAFGFDAPAAIRSDNFMVQGVRLPYVVFPRRPQIGNPPRVAPIIRSARVFANTN
ncbi:MAG TPA: heme-binding protein [Blastocatellia bacterium]|jgi:Uncharacterized protein, possibly involved in utilization of glycolate and propanediol